MHAFSYMQMTVTDQFVKAWRQRALELQREFDSFERFYLASRLRSLGVLPLREPYDIDSGSMLSSSESILDLSAVRENFLSRDLSLR